MTDTAATTRAEQKLITRQRLLETTIDIIADEGFAGVTMAKVAERAGLSRGICNFHFQTKEQLMLEAFRGLYIEHEQTWRKILTDDARSAAERLSALIETLLTPPIADHKKVAVWLAFWGVTPHRQTYLNVCTEVDCQYEDAITELLHELAGGQEKLHGLPLRSIAVSLTALIDGTLLQYLIAPGRLSPNEAIRSCLTYLGSFFPQFR
ncbi:MAG: TetR family transcriptional regulator C-terminal domain-containing protein [Desulfuromonadales bacterium]|nr:TetR family transcriptional regulator C-terminal domain-containing protein [Desulfuromonadales bacterium]